MGKIKRTIEELKSGKVDRVAVIYLAAASALFIIMCLAMGHPAWIFRVLFENTVSDLSGEVPRMMALEYLEGYFTFSTDSASLEAFDSEFTNSVLAMLPEIAEFSCIDAFILSLIKNKSAITKLLSFFAGYVLQALIAISWTDPVTWSIFADLAGEKLMIFWFYIWAFGAMIYVVFQTLFRDDDDMERQLNDCVYTAMAPLFAVLYILFKSLCMIFFFDCIFIELIFHAGAYADFLSNIVSIILPIISVPLIRWLDHPLDWISEKLVKSTVKATDFTYKYEKRLIDEIFCAGISLSIIVYCFVLYFRLT